MAAPVKLLRASFFFQDGRFGWSENYYCNDVSSTPTNKTVLSSALLLATKRTALLAVGPTLTYIRVTDELKRDALQYHIRNAAFATNVPQGGGQPAIKAAAKASGVLLADNPYSAIELRFTDTAGQHTCVHPLSGVADQFILDQAFDFVTPPGDAWLTAYTDFRSKLISAGSIWGFRIRDLETYPPVSIDAVALDVTTGWIAVTTHAPLPLPATLPGYCQTPVAIRHAKMNPGSVKLNGNYQIQSID